MRTNYEKIHFSDLIFQLAVLYTERIFLPLPAYNLRLRQRYARVELNGAVKPQKSCAPDGLNQLRF